MDLENKIVEVLKTIYDPEIPVDVYELGLIYEVKIDKEANVEIEMPNSVIQCRTRACIAYTSIPSVVRL